LALPNRPKTQQVYGGLGKKRLQRVLAYINDNLVENIGLQDLVTLAGLGQHHFSTMFKQSMGISPYRCVVSS
jgi:AraC family transcriptional regulator